MRQTYKSLPVTRPFYSRIAKVRREMGSKISWTEFLTQLLDYCEYAEDVLEKRGLDQAQPMVSEHEPVKPEMLPPVTMSAQ